MHVRRSISFLSNQQCRGCCSIVGPFLNATNYIFCFACLLSANSNQKLAGFAGFAVLTQPWTCLSNNLHAQCNAVRSVVVGIEQQIKTNDFDNFSTNKTVATVLSIWHLLIILNLVKIAMKTVINIGFEIEFPTKELIQWLCRTFPIVVSNVTRTKWKICSAKLRWTAQIHIRIGRFRERVNQSEAKTRTNINQCALCEQS